MVREKWICATMCHQHYHAHGVCLKDIQNLVAVNGCPLGCVEIEGVIQNEIARHDKVKHPKISGYVKSTDIGVGVHKRAGKLQIPSQRIGRSDNHGIQHNMQSVEIFLVIFYHNRSLLYAFLLRFIHMPHHTYHTLFMP